MLADDLIGYAIVGKAYGMRYLLSHIGILPTQAFIRNGTYEPTQRLF